MRTLLDENPSLALLQVTCGDLGLVESIYGWQVLDRVMWKAVDLVRGLQGGALSPRVILALNGIAGEEILIFEPGEDAGKGIDAEEAARRASAVARALEAGFGSEGFHSMTPKLSFRVGYSLIQENPHFRFERIVYRALEQARTRQAKREQRRQTEWGAALRRIIRDGEVTTLYQPVVRLDTLEVVGYEAFSCGPGSGPLSAPGMLFALSERLGVSGELDRVCRRAAVRRAGPLPGEMKLFINTRPGNLADPEWGSEELLESLSRVHLRPEDVVIEVPEGAVADAEALRGPVECLRGRGFRIALDDVGTGYSSVRSIEAVRPDYLKVDLSLVHEVDRSLLKQEVLTSLLQIAARVGAQVIAEGIETEEELSTVRRSGAHMGQGYFFARPSPVIAGAAFPSVGGR